MAPQASECKASLPKPCLVAFDLCLGTELACTRLGCSRHHCVTLWVQLVAEARPRVQPCAIRDVWEPEVWQVK